MSVKLVGGGKGKDTGGVHKQAHIHIFVCVCVCVYVYIGGETYIYIHIYKDSIMKSAKYCFKSGEKKEGLREYNRGGEFIQSALYTSMELSQ
jgi:hypothetical protein